MKLQGQNFLTGEEKPESQEKDHQPTMLPRQNGSTGEEKPESQEKDHQPTSNQNPDGGGKSELDSQKNNQQPTNRPEDESATSYVQIRMLSWKSREKFLRLFQTTRRYKPVKKEYLACIGSSVTLQWQAIELERPNSTERETITGKLQCMKKESAGQYICCKDPGISDDITLSILQPREQQAFVNDDVTFDATNCTTNKEYKWTYIHVDGDNNETDIITDKMYVVVNNEDARKFTLKGCRKEDNGIYICRDKETDEQLAAYRLSILQPREQQAFVNDDVTFDATNCTTNKEYKWSYMDGDNIETDIIPDRRWVVVNNEDTRKLTIKGYRKKDNGIYICRDKETDEQLTAYRLSILQPREQQAFVKDDVTFDATNCTTNKEYKWSYIDGDNNETDIIPDRRYVVVNNKNTRKLTIKGCRKEDNGVYIFRDKETDEQLTAYRLSILQPREQRAFVNDDVTFDATNCTTNKEYKWSYMDGDNNETDIIPDRRYVVVNNEDTRKVTIKGCRQEDNGIYICRDKETDEQLTAYRLKTKPKRNNLKVVLTFMESPEDEEFKQNLIYSTEQLLRTLPDRVVKIRTHEEPMEPNSKTIQIVAYLNRRQNKTDLEERMKFNQASVCILFLADHMSQPTIPLDRNHITISFRKYSNTVKCSFYDDSQKDTWNKLLKEFTED